MKRLLALLTAMCFAVGYAVVFCVRAVDVSAEAAVLLCADTLDVLYERQAHTRLSMASTTKIMTALLTIEEYTPQRVVHVTAPMVRVEGTSMGLLPGDSVSLYALSCGMLLSSGNDAANTAAVSISGSIEAFCIRMNARAQEIGMTDTHFVTPSGLDDEAHYSTAYDMALLAAEAIRNPVFRSICSSHNITVSYGNPPYRRTLTNHNRLLQSFEGCVGVKTGFTRKSGRCLVSAAEREGVTLVAVTLNDPDDWRDHTAMLEYGFDCVRSVQADADLHGLAVPVVGSKRNSVSVRFAEQPFFVTAGEAAEPTRKVYIQPFLYAPVHKGTVVGKAVYTLAGKAVCTADIVTAGGAAYFAPTQTECVKKQDLFSKWTETVKGVWQAWHKRFGFKNSSPNAALPRGEKRRK